MAETDFIWRFTPSRTDPRVLEEIFVQRHDLLTYILECIRESAQTGNKHQVLLVGPRGIGKTHLIALLHHRIMREPSTRDRVRIAWLLEDETITSFVQLLKRIYELLAEGYPEDFPSDWLEDVLDRQPARIQKALEAAMVKAFSHKTLLLFVENLDLVFEGLGDAGQKQWRSFLQTHPFTTVIATSQRLARSVKGRDQPFFGFFNTKHLKPLPAKDAVELLRRIGRHNGQDELVAFLATPEGRSRVRAIHHLAGGNHRIYIVLSGFITRESLDELASPFEKMADELTPYYQERMRWLSPQQRQIVEYLCSREETCTPKEIARHLLAAENSVSSQLKKLLELGYVLRSPRGRESLYELAEPLMRLASEVKEKRHKPLSLLVNFLRVWYRPETLSELLGRAGTFSLRAHIHAALSQSESSPDPRLRILESEIERAEQEHRFDDLLQILEERAHARNAPTDWGELAVHNFNRLNYAAALLNCDRALALDPRCVIALATKGRSLSSLERYDEALRCFESALSLDPLDYSSCNGQGYTLMRLGELDAAIACFDRAVDIDPREFRAWLNKGDALRALGRFGEALEAYGKAIEIYPNIIGALFGKAYSLAELGRIEDALASYDEVLKIHPDEATSLNNKGNLLRDAGRFDEALWCYDEALKINPLLSLVWGNKIDALQRMGRFEEAAAACDRALELENRSSGVRAFKAEALRMWGRLEEALLACSEALEIDPQSVMAWGSKGAVLNAMERHEDALESADRALELDPDYAFGLMVRGVALHGLKRYEEGLISFDKALELSPRDTSVLRLRGWTLATLGRSQEALESYERALEIEPCDIFAWSDKAFAEYKLGRLEAALASFEMALQIDGDDAQTWNNKGYILNELRRHTEAIECLDRAVEKDPLLPYGWNNRGHTFAKLGRHHAARESYARALAADREYHENSTDKNWTFYRAEPMFALDRWEEGFAALRDAFARHPLDTSHDILDLVDCILNLRVAPEDLLRILAGVISVYRDAKVLTYLGSGLVRSLGRIDAARLGGNTLEMWRSTWLEAGAHIAELDLSMRLFRVGIEYLIRGDEKVLLDLVTVERMILRQALRLSMND